MKNHSHQSVVRSAIRAAALLPFGLALAAASPALAQDWKPTRPVNLIVPSNPGGGHDNNARILASTMEKYAGQPINIVNQAAGGGVVAYNQMMKAKPDGYTVGQISVSVVSDQFRISGVTYNKDSYTYLGQISSDQNLLVVKADGPFGKMNVKEFVAYAKDNPGKVPFGVSGNWTNHDYTRFQIEDASGAKFLRVPQKGGSEIVLSILSGDVQAGALYPSEVKSQVDAGALKILAHNGDRALEGWPDVPTFTSQGLAVDLSIWRALVLPKETPANIVAGWRKILEETMKDPAVKQAYATAGIGYAYRNAEDMEKLVEAADNAYRTISAKAGVKVSN
ncbi:tripartite tricarboxylate transporter substrate binding protein [Microvirga pudoricolor]|uniref:tripartite tricarboxylate transporter substrate binding protein n=1 Tax=Microvirga pudoricolor TaxID=2778729 RepID=UPI00194E30D5|nr:tripartite tricarboxylate transporter substrate binding protein [Microvirga pudoricolor]MBM6596549.1 tripartite tricarboxylate transporter substrate binding protein [Microvirga pudoricolor]